MFEISAPQPKILWRLVGFVDVTDTRRLLEDPRLRIRIEDGRKALEAGEATYDLIETDATWPETRGQRQPLLGRVLRGGLAPAEAGRSDVHWAPTPRVGRDLSGRLPARARRRTAATS